MVLSLGQYWLWAGAGVAALFLTFGMDRIDEDARGAYIFRPLLIPGVLLIWPIVLWRWATLEFDRDSWRHRHLPERRCHAPLWCVFAVLIPLTVIVGLTLEQPWPEGTEPVLLEAAQ
jgi:hypothetical protein